MLRYIITRITSLSLKMVIKLSVFKEKEEKPKQEIELPSHYETLFLLFGVIKPLYFNCRRILVTNTLFVFIRFKNIRSLVKLICL